MNHETETKNEHIEITLLTDEELKPNIYGNRPIYSPVFDDIYTSEISVEFDYSNVDFMEIQKNEKQENVMETNVK